MTVSKASRVGSTGHKAPSYTCAFEQPAWQNLKQAFNTGCPQIRKQLVEGTLLA